MKTTTGWLSILCALDFLCAGGGLLVYSVVGATAAEKSSPWWTALDCAVLAELRPGEFEQAVPKGWQVLQGGFSVVSDDAAAAGPHKALEAKAARSSLYAGDADWQRYAVTAEVKFSTVASGTVSLAAGCALDGKNVKPGYQVNLAATKGQSYRLGMGAADREGTIEFPQVSIVNTRRKLKATPLLLKPNLDAWTSTDLLNNRPELKNQTRQKLDREFADVLPVTERWFRLRVEVTPLQARLWVDGILVASVDGPRWTQGGVCLSMNRGDRVRCLRVETLPERCDGFLPLDLAARCNRDGLSRSDKGFAFDPAGLPSPERFITVNGVPFHWSARAGRPNCLDISVATFRGQEQYIRTDAAGGDPRRLLLRAPKRQYRALAIVAAADTDEKTTNVLNVRMFKPGRGMVLDACCPIPRWNATETAAGVVPLPARVLAAGREADGKLWLVRVPLDPGAFQDFLNSNDEYCLELDLTSAPRRDGYCPVVPTPVGIRIFAATLIEAPVEMTVTSGEPGHIFVEPQTPTFNLNLVNRSVRAQSGRVQVNVSDFYGRKKTQTFAYRLRAGEHRSLAARVPVAVRGLHYLDAQLLDAPGATLVRRRTTFAVLPPDTRQADTDSPFGMWVFTDAHYGGGLEAAGSLMRKIGVRWSLVPDNDEFIARHHVYPAYTGLLRHKSAGEALEKLAKSPHLMHLAVFQETALGSRHYHYFPPELLEQPAPMPLTAEEEKRLKEYWDKAAAYCAAVRKDYPNRKLIFGCGYPQFIATFLSRGFPRQYMDGLGLDFIGDRMNFFFYLREVARHYGYGDLPLHITEGFYAGSGCGYYPDAEREKTQSDIYIQGFLRGLAMGIERFGAACEIWDPGSDYHFTGYGSVGLCHMSPELNPKPGYCAYGTMTCILDRAKFHSVVPTGSIVTPMLRFDTPAGPVYAAWVIAGRRTLSFNVGRGAAPRLTDGQGNSQPLKAKSGRVEFQVSTSPVYLEGAGIVSSFSAGPPEYDSAPVPTAKTICPAARLREWAADPQPCAIVEELNESIPVRHSQFSLQVGPGRSAATQALAVTLKDQPGVSPHRLRYSVLRPTGDKLVVPAGTTKLGVWVSGNGAAYVDLELEDAKGKQWTTVQKRPAYSFGMSYRGPQAFDGWKYLTFPLEDTAQQPSPWRSNRGGGSITLPATITGLVIEQYTKAVHVNALASPPPAARMIGDILAE